MSNRWVDRVFALKLKPREQLLLLAMAHAADEDGVVRNLSDSDLRWMMGELGKGLHSIRQSLLSKGIIERVEGGDDVAPEAYALRLSGATPRKAAPLDTGMSGTARIAMIQAFQCTCQHCGASGNQVFDAQGKVWRISKLSLSLGLSADNTTLLCAQCAGRNDVSLDRLPSAADRGLRWGQRFWSYAGSDLPPAPERI